MSGKTSFFIVGVVLIALIIFVYIFSTPKLPTHVMPVGVDGSSRSLPVVDSAARSTDTLAK